MGTGCPKRCMRSPYLHGYLSRFKVMQRPYIPTTTLCWERQNKTIFLRRRNLVLEERTVGLLPRLRVLIRRILCLSDSCKRNTSFFPQEQNSFAKNQLMKYSSGKKHCSLPTMIFISEKKCGSSPKVKSS